MKIIKLLLILSSIGISVVTLQANELNKEKTPEPCYKQKMRHARHWRCPDLQKSMATTETDDTKKKRSTNTDSESFHSNTGGGR